MGIQKLKTAAALSLSVAGILLASQNIRAISSTPTILEAETNCPVYGVDVSFPMHYDNVSVNYPWLPHNGNDYDDEVPEEYKDMPLQELGDRKEFMNDFFAGCEKNAGEDGRCLTENAFRVEMCLTQPKCMHNYTDLGFKKIRAPEKLFGLIVDFYEKNKLTETAESWHPENIIVNHWVAPTYMVSVENEELDGGGSELKGKIWDEAKDIIHGWTGQELEPSSLYGVRIYKEGAVLSTHVDRVPLISSAIINVAQDVDEPWPVEVIGHDGKAYNITMEPGDMVLYESHSILHGRPFPLKGRFYANIFIHFEPKTEVLEDNGGYPAYFVDKEECQAWHQSNMAKVRKRSPPTEGDRVAHMAAANGNMRELERILKDDPNKLHAQDANKWTPLHEAARAGNLAAVEFLWYNGANVHARTNIHTGFPKGMSALDIALSYLGKEHDVIRYIQSWIEELEQSKLEQSKLEQSKLEQSKLEQSKLEQSELEQSEQSESEQSELDQSEL